MTSSDVMPLLDTTATDARNRSNRRRCRPARGDRKDPNQERVTTEETRQQEHAAERKLISQLVRREPSAWREFLDRYERLIYSRVLAAHDEIGRPAHQDVIDDCCAEVLTALFRNDLVALKRFQGRSRLSTWLAVVARRVTLNVLLKRQRDADRTRQEDSRFDLSTVVAARVPTGLSGDLDCDEILMRQCLTELKSADQAVLKMHFEERLTYEQIGAALGISANAVGPKLSRAAKRLRSLVNRKRQQAKRRSMNDNDQSMTE